MIAECDLLIYILENPMLTTKKAADDLGVSQQTISRKLIQMEKSNLARRDVSVSGIRIDLTNKGRSVLLNHYLKLKNLFDKIDTCIEGELVTGMGEGRYYVSVYSSQFKEKLNFDPFPGTLNLKADPVKILEFLSGLEPINISGFKEGDRTFGRISAYKITISGIPAAVVVPERTHHEKNILEIIAPKNLRSKLKLNDGDPVILTL